MQKQLAYLLTINFLERSLGVGLDAALLDTFSDTSGKTLRESVANAFQIRARDNSVTTEGRNDELIFKGEEIGGDERDTGIVAIERSDEGSGLASGVVFEMDRAFGEESRTEGLQIILDKCSTGFGDELSEDFALCNDDEFVGARVEMGQNKAARLDDDKSESGIDVGQKGRRFSGCGNEFSGRGCNDGGRGRVGEVKGK